MPDGKQSLKDVVAENAPAVLEHLDSAAVRIGEWVEATESFTVEQAPFLVQEILYWAVADAAYWVVFGLVFVGFLPLSLRYLRRSQTMPEGKKTISAALEEKGTDLDTAVAWIGGLIFPLLGSLLIANNIMDMLKPLVAPRLYLIEYFRELVG
jgi:hypothetical protein